MRTLDVFKNLRKNPWFVSPILYIHPHMKMVKLTQPNPFGGDRQKLNLREDQSLIPLSEALHSFLPGMWTRRMPQSTFKVLVGETFAVGGRSLEASIERMSEGGFRYEVVKKSLPPPPGLPGEIQVISPLEIPIRPLINKRTIRTDLTSPRVLDGDEGQPGGDSANPRIPKSFAQRWLNVELNDGKEIEAYSDLDEAERLIETQHGDGTDCDIDMSNLTHPFSEGAFSSVSWHKGTVVTEYVYGLSRTLRTENDFGTEIFYANQRGAHITFGQKINTEGIAFTLKSKLFEETKLSAMQNISNGSPEWIPSMIRG